MRKHYIVTVSGMVVLLFCAFIITLRYPGRRMGTFYAMGGIPVQVTVYGRSRLAFRQDFAAVRARIDELENVFSRYRASSAVTRLTAAGKGCSEGVAPELVRLIEESRMWSVRSGGAFDITVGPLVDLWKRAGAAGVLPDERMLDEARARVGMRMVHTDGDRVCFAQGGMSLDLGAIAKGALLDAAAATLHARGAQRGAVEAGGDVAAFGPDEFTIGIRDPSSKDSGALMGTLTMRAGGVVTSGDYERYVTIAGKRYSHIIDPRTGRPADGLVAVTVVGPNATDADALATALAVMGRAEGIELLKKLSDYAALFVTRTGRQELTISCTRSLCEHLHLDVPWVMISF